MADLPTMTFERKAVRAMSLTEDLVALCHRDVPKRELESHHARFNDDDFDRAADEVLAALSGDPIWVFAYGYLIWKPAASPVEQRRSCAFGWHRSFCIDMFDWRGTPEQPGLMMALRKGGTCTGIAQRLQGKDRHGEMVGLLRREIGGPVGYSSLRLVDLHSEEGPLRSLCFYADPDEVANQPELPAEEVASRLASACGHAGSGAEYLYRTVAALEAHDIHDPHLWRLQELVAAEITRRHFSPWCTPLQSLGAF